MDIDWGIHVGNLIEILILFSGLVVVFTRLRDRVAVLHDDLVKLEVAVEKLSGVIITVAVNSQKVQTLETEVRDLKEQLKRI